MQRHHGRFDCEYHQEQHRCDADTHGRAGIDQGNALRQIGHVERSCLGIDSPKRKEKQRRAQEVIEHILHPGPQPRRAAGVDHQPVGSDQQHFEKDEEVEKVARQERPHDPHQLELEQRVKMPPAFVPFRADDIEQHEERQHRRQRDHQRRQTVAHQHDAKGCCPIAETVEHDIAARRLDREAKPHGDQRERPEQRQHPLDGDVVACGQNDEGRNKCGQHDGQDQPMGHVRSSALISVSGSSTWSSLLPR